jgi:hypothetical protein
VISYNQSVRAFVVSPVTHLADGTLPRKDALAVVVASHLLLNSADVNAVSVKHASHVVHNRVDSFQVSAWPEHNVHRGNREVVNKLPHVNLVHVHNIVNVQHCCRQVGSVDRVRRSLQQDPSGGFRNAPPSVENHKGRRHAARWIHVRRPLGVGVVPIPLTK